ncbi:MAG: fused MFS/spermidine synthase [Patescibacteria group bacterium]
MDQRFLYLLSFATNALVLVLEITGGRLLAPYLGTSVGVWAGLIAVVLGSMALGYHVGGKFADTDASPRRITSILLAASVTALIAWSVRDLAPTSITATHLEPTLHAVMIGAILFMPSVILLAGVSPFLAKNLIKRLDTTAHVVGDLNAVGTAGAIVGAIVTGIYLIPYFSVDHILLGVALALFALTILTWRGLALPLVAIVILSTTLAWSLNAVPTRADGWRAEYSTAYNRIVITETDTTRAVWTSPFGIQCQMFVTDEGTVDPTRLVETYQRAHDILVAALVPEGAHRALFLGGCVAAFPRYLTTRYPSLDATVVELDPGMTKVAQELFDFDPTTVTMIHEDARVFVNNDHEPYDLVYVDAFGSSGRVPFHLVTEEMFARLAAHVSSDGFLIMNTHGSYEGPGLLYPSVFVKTAETAFAHVALYQFTQDPLSPQNLVILASPSRELPEQFTDPRYPDLTLTKVTTLDHVRILTDRYAPVEGLSREKLLDS